MTNIINDFTTILADYTKVIKQTYTASDKPQYVCCIISTIPTLQYNINDQIIEAFKVERMLDDMTVAIIPRDRFVVVNVYTHKESYTKILNEIATNNNALIDVSQGLILSSAAPITAIKSLQTIHKICTPVACDEKKRHWFLLREFLSLQQLNELFDIGLELSTPAKKIYKPVLSGELLGIPFQDAKNQLTRNILVTKNNRFLPIITKPMSKHSSSIQVTLHINLISSEKINEWHKRFLIAGIYPQLQGKIKTIVKDTPILNSSQPYNFMSPDKGKNKRNNNNKRKGNPNNNKQKQKQKMKATNLIQQFNDGQSTSQQQ